MRRLPILMKVSVVVSCGLLAIVTGLMRSLIEGLGVIGVAFYVFALMTLVAALPSGISLVAIGIAGVWRKVAVENGMRRDYALQVVLGCLNVLLFITYTVMWVFFVFPAFGDVSYKCRPAPCMSNLRNIDNAKEQVALELKWTNGQPVVNGDSNVNRYITGLDGTTNMPYCPDGGQYSYNSIGRNPTCSIGAWDPARREKMHLGPFWWRWYPEIHGHVLPTP